MISIKEQRLALGMAVVGYMNLLEAQDLMGRTDTMDNINARATMEGLKAAVETMDQILPVFEELASAKKKHPTWPADLVRCTAFVAEESGEFVRAVNELDDAMRRGSDASVIDVLKEEVRKECLHTAATAIRFLENLK